MRLLFIKPYKYDTSLSLVTFEISRQQGAYFRIWAEERKYLYMGVDPSHYGIAQYGQIEVIQVRLPEVAITEMVLRWG